MRRARHEPGQVQDADRRRRLRIGVMFVLAYVVFVVGILIPLIGRPMADATSGSMDPYIQGDISSGAWSAKCQPTFQRGPIDPIRYYASTAPHDHEFWAPLVMNSTIQPTNLIGASNVANLCIGPTATPFPSGGCVHTGTPSSPGLAPPTDVCDKSAYWVPVLYFDTDPTNPAVAPAVISPDHMNIYWRNEYEDPFSVSPYPRYFAAVAGNATATTPQDKWIVNWQCVDDVRPKYETPGPTSQTIPSSCDLPVSKVCHSGDSDPCAHMDPVYLRLVVTFPECIVLSDLSATSGMQTPESFYYNMTGRETPPSPTASGDYYNCVAGYLEIPTIQIDPHWLINKGVNTPYVPVSTISSAGVDYLHFDLSRLLLSSDLMMDQMHTMTVPPGLTSHADYENGYTHADLVGLVAMCFHFAPEGQNCGDI